MSKINKIISGIILILLTSFIFSLFYFFSLALVEALDLNVDSPVYTIFIVYVWFLIFLAVSSNE